MKNLEKIFKELKKIIRKLKKIRLLKMSFSKQSFHPKKRFSLFSKSEKPSNEVHDYKYFTDSSEEFSFGEEDEAKSAFNSLTMDIAQLSSEVKSLQAENYFLQEKLRLYTIEKSNLIAQHELKVQNLEKELNDIKENSAKESSEFKTQFEKLTFEHNEINKNFQVLYQQKLKSDQAHKKNFEKIKNHYLIIIQEKDEKISEMHQILKTTQKLDEKVREILEPKKKPSKELFYSKSSSITPNFESRKSINFIENNDAKREIFSVKDLMRTNEEKIKELRGMQDELLKRF